MTELPPGFVLDQPKPQGTALPAGFVLDKPEEPSIGMKALRAAEFGSRGFMDSAAETLGALPDLVARGLGAVGIPAPPPGNYTNAIKAGMDAFGRTISAPLNAVLPAFGPNTPQSAIERGAEGAGRGVADAAAIAVPAAAVARTARAGTVLQGAGQALSAQPVAQAVSGAAGGAVGEATDNPLLGTAAALAVPFGAGAARRLISPVPNQLTPEQARLAQVLGNEGVELRPGQATGSRALQTMESVLDNLPFSSSQGRAIRDTQQVAFNRAVLQRAGINADRATPDVVDAAFRRLGNEFERLSAQTTVNLDNQFLNDLQQTATRYGNKLPSQTREVFQNYVNDILNVGNAMPGQTYQVTRSDLTRQARSLTNADPALSQALRGLRNALDDAAGRSIPPALRDEWQEARNHYANLKTIARAMSTSGATSAAGDVPAGQLMNAVKAGVGRDQFTRGAGDLNDLARAGNAFIKSQIPDSGTAQRSMMTSLLQGGPLTGGMGTAAIASGGDPLMMAGGAAAGAAIPPLVAALMNSPAGRAYLTNQVATNAGPRVTRQLVAALLAARAREPLTQAITAR